MPCFSATEHSPGFQLFKLSFGILVLFHGIAAVKLDNNLNPDGCGEAEPTGRIYRGKPISREQIPWIVHLMVYWPSNSTHCGASIITSDVLLTAAHCVINPPEKATRITATYNSTGVYGKPDWSDLLYIESVKWHPKYSLQDGGWYDIALLKLPRRLRFDRFVKPVCLPAGEVDVDDKTLLVAGWGQKHKYNKFSYHLLFTQVVGMPAAECKSFLKQSRAKGIRIRGGPAICVNVPDGSICGGDSGGPLTLQDSNGKSVQVGVVSLGVECPEEGERPTPGVFTKISGYRSWIREVLKRPRQWHKLHVVPPVYIYDSDE